MSLDSLICMGCGVQIQTEDKHDMGYAPPSALKHGVVICQRCFRLKNYGEIQDVPFDDQDYLKILAKIGQTKALVVKIVDVFDFTGSWISGLHRHTGGNDVLLVGNKIDLLPQSTNENRLKQWMRHSAKELGLKPKDVFLISARSGKGVDELAAGIDQLRGGGDVYVVGCTNVGKSTFINDLIQGFSGDNRSLVTTSIFPGTTLNLIDFPLEGGRTLYDTPGVVNRGQMVHYLNAKELKRVTPAKPIKPKVYQLDSEQTLFFGGLGRLDYERGGGRPFVCYFSNELYIHRTKLEKADELYETQVGELLKPPEKGQENTLPSLVKHHFTIKNEKMDIVFSGLGWVSINAGSGNLSAYAPKGVDVSIRESLI